jgi:hypothetical protein
VSKLTDQWIELFRSGKHGGDQKEFTDAELDEIVANYSPANPEFEEAPATIGHPQQTAPAWGWFSELKRKGDLLLGKMKDVQPEFEEMVEKRLFPKRSVGLVKRAKGWMLHHVAFLGAAAPAVKGLTDCRFVNTDGTMEVEFQESEMADSTVNEATFLEKLGAKIDEFINGKKAAGSAPVTFTEADVKRIAGEAAKDAVEAAVAPLQAKLDAAEAKFSEHKTALVTAETTARGENAVAKLKTAGKWIPAYAALGLPLVFAELAKTTETVEFGEGDAKKTLTPLDTLVAFMEGLPKIVPGGELFTGKRSTKGTTSDIRFNERDARADRNSVDLANLAADRAKEKKITYAEALQEIKVEHPELLVPGGSTAGEV